MTYEDLRKFEIQTKLRMVRLMMLDTARTVGSNHDIYFKFMDVYEAMIDLADEVSNWNLEDSNDWD